MNPVRRHSPIVHSNGILATALVLIGLLMQMLAPYLPMPMAGGSIGPTLAWSPICSLPQSGEDGNGASHFGDCAACLVMQQAGSLLAPPLAMVALPAAASQKRPSPWCQAQCSSPISEAFSSRAPPPLV